MDARLVTLRLFLEALDIPPSIETVEQRKLIQKAVYIGQLSGVDLGYRFGWYLMGPYCPELTRDYYALDAQGDNRSISRRLHSKIEEKLRRLEPLLKPSADVSLKQSDWLELLASYHFLRKIRRLTHEEALKTLERYKPSLAAYASVAYNKLREFNLLT